jgi:hypothetical protein
MHPSSHPQIIQVEPTRVLLEALIKSATAPANAALSSDEAFEIAALKF